MKMQWPYLRVAILKACLRGTIVTAMWLRFFEQQMSCMGFNASFHMVQLQQQN